MSPEDGAGRRMKNNNPLNFPGAEDTQLEVRSPVKLLTVLRGRVRGILFAHFPIK